LVFGPQNTDEEMQQFAELTGGDSFLRLEPNQIVSNNTIVTLEDSVPPQQSETNDDGGTLEDFQEWQRLRALEEGN